MGSKEYNVLIGALLLLTIVTGVSVGTISYTDGYYDGYKKRMDEEKVEEWCKELGGIKSDIRTYYLNPDLCIQLHKNERGR